jgi:SAM-dependent methyltransferase
LGYRGRWICARAVGEALELGGDGDGLVAALQREGHRAVAADAERAGDLPFEDGSFDTVVLGDFLAAWASRERPLAEARRVLRPGGRLIVAVPYAAGPGGEGDGVSLHELLGELGQFSVAEMETVDDRLCVLAERKRARGAATVWRQALAVAEGRLAGTESDAAALRTAVAELEAGREREQRALADARADVERLETALAGAAHRRDLEQEKARLAGEGVAELEQRLERLRRDGERERLEAERTLERQAAEAERKRGEELAEAEQRLERLRRDGERERLEAERTLERQAAEAERKRGEELAEAEQRRGEELAEAEQRRGEELAELEGRLAEAERSLAEAEQRRERELAAAGLELAAARARLEEREAELRRSGEAAGQARQDLASTRERLGESERELAVRERDLAARVRELGQAGEELVARERELEIASDRLAALQGELDAAGALLDARDAELARAEQDARAALRGRDEARSRLQAREQHLRTAQLGVESRDRRLELSGRKLEAAERTLRSRDRELERLRATVRERERKLALSEARREKAQQRAEAFRGSLVEIRSGRSYRLMRILWRLRRPFRRAPRDAAAPVAAAAEDADAAPPGSAAPRPTPAPSRPPAVAAREPASHPAGERLRVASILDEMSAACFAPECELVPLALEGWHEQLDERRPDLLLVESAWNGNGGEWQYRIAQYPRPDLAGLPALRALLDGCRERGIPTAFWNKEDPVHFERFAEAAALFDHVFTTDARCVERYRALPGERTVAALPFAAQPRIHNPVAAVPERSASPCFAGAWYRDRHPDRRRSLEALLDAARPHGLVIYDRRFGAEDAAFGFPERFAPHILGRLPYERILDVYKSHRVFLNANSVADSPTMCSRRVFELAACDTAIVSTPGAALSALLGEDVVAEAADETSAAAALERLLGEEDERRRRVRTARRAVFAAHTYAERLATIAETAGLDAASLRREPFAAPGGAAGGAGGAPNGNGFPWRLELQPGVALSAPALADLAAAATFADADVIGAAPARNGAAAVEHRRATDLDPRALLIRRELVESRGRLDGSPEQIHARLREWSDEGVSLYAADADLLVS